VLEAVNNGLQKLAEASSAKFTRGDRIVQAHRIMTPRG
jgi:hypothetical protein